MKTLVIATITVISISLSSCYKTSYHCNQVLVSGEDESQIEQVSFGERKKQWEDFADSVAGDTTHINDSTYLFWECYGAK